MKPVVISFYPDGRTECFGRDPLNLSQNKRRTRFSEIVPINPLKRAVFRTVRLLFGDKGRAADWTRRWRCRWRARILSTGKFQDGNCREQLLDWEREQYFLKQGINL